MVGTQGGANRTACMLTARHGFVMSSLAPKAVVHRLTQVVQKIIVQFATPQNDIIAMCNGRSTELIPIQLILKDIFLK
jgi:hypothetical protein